MTPDPLGGDITNPQSLNRYAYALNNPTTNIDPSGLTNIPGYDLGGRWGGGSCSLYVACGLPTPGGGFGSNWNEFGPLNIPVVTQSYTWPQLLSTINWAAMGNANGYATSVSFYAPGGWSTTQVGTGFDLIGMFENPYRLPPTPSPAEAFVKSFVTNFPSTTWRSLTSSSGCPNSFFSNTASNLNPFTPSASSLAEPAANVINAVKFDSALAYAASRPNYLGGTGLLYPFKSSAFTSALKAGQDVLDAVPVAQLDLALGQALGTEVESASAGECH